MLEKLKGWKTFLAVVVYLAAGLAAAFGVVPSPEDAKGLDLAIAYAVELARNPIVTAVVYGLLRLVTDTPIFKRQSDS